VPSYKEEPDVIWQTLMSAALMEWPNRRIALLIDDPVNPRGDEDQRVLDGARALPRQIQSLLSQPARHLRRELAEFEKRLHAGSYSAPEETDRLCRLYEYAANWLDRQARQREQKPTRIVCS
jgi:cellulose synthase (UDP-forming)